MDEVKTTQYNQEYLDLSKEIELLRKNIFGYQEHVEELRKRFILEQETNFVTANDLIALQAKYTELVGKTDPYSEEKKQRFLVILEPEYKDQDIAEISADEFKAGLEDTMFTRTFTVKEIKE